MKATITFTDRNVTQHLTVIPQEIYNKYNIAKHNQIKNQDSILESNIINSRIDSLMKTGRFCTSESPIGKAIVNNDTYFDNMNYRHEVKVIKPPYELPFSVCAIMMNDKGEVLSVSRRNDHNDFGLAGGKIDPDETAIEALVREVFEETNIKIDPTKCFLVFSELCGDKRSDCYIVSEFDDSTILQNEGEGIIEYKTWNDLCKGSFGDYNNALKTSLGF